MSSLRPVPVALLILATVAARAAEEPVVLPVVSVYSDRVANQTPVATFAMPVSSLSFEPLVDVQARNFAEAQADVSIRGGTFENTGFKLGAVSQFDPQTGHYLAELPVSPEMLTAPRVLTGAGNAGTAFNAGVGAVAYGWQPIGARGVASLAGGEYHTGRATAYQAWAHRLGRGWSLGTDAEFAHSESNGSVPFGDHQFKRLSGRLQLRGPASQTDLFLGSQTKFFGWPNLYTPFGFNETEDIETELFALNHRAWQVNGDFWEVGASYRRNDDDYEFNRAVPGASNPFQHVTHVRSVAFAGRQSADALAVNYSAQFSADHLRSTSLTFGRFRSRDYVKLAVVPEYNAEVAAGRLIVRAGATYDDTNRDGSAISPLVSLALRTSPRWNWRLEYAESTQVPTYTALNSNPSAGLFRGNPNLGRETSRNLEAGFEWSEGAWSVRAAAFRRADDKLVDWTFRYGVTARTANAVNVVNHGVELVATWHSARADLVVGYTWLEKSADYGASTIDASFYALNFPRHRLTAAAILRLGAGFELRLDNEYRVQERNALRTIGGDEAWLTGAGLYYHPPQIPAIELSLRTDNVWNSDFQEVPAVPAGRRQTVLGVAYRW